MEDSAGTASSATSGWNLGPAAGMYGAPQARGCEPWCHEVCEASKLPVRSGRHERIWLLPNRILR